MLNNHNKYDTAISVSSLIIIFGKRALFEPWPSLEDSARLHLVFTSLDFVEKFFTSKILSLASNPQPVFMSPRDRVAQL
jgi:hypothetical protein